VATYRVDGGALVVKARSKIHDITTTWSKVGGTVTADPETLGTVGATASFEVDMTVFDAGDWLKNRKLRSDFALDDHPRATFELRAVRDVVRDGPTFTATAEGVIKWRGKEAAVTMKGQGKLDETSVEASASFDLDIRLLGLAAPRFLIIKMSDEVTIDVRVKGRIA
jgi:polyisoprenoid-binding protein YceI